MESISMEKEIQSTLTSPNMGYVFADASDIPAFIAGNDVITVGADIAQHIQPGVTDQNFHGASKFGLSDVYTGESFTDPTGEFNLADDINTVLASFVGPQSPWRTEETAAAILALALRPAVPATNFTSGHLHGPIACGKTWTARSILSFWQSEPDAWLTGLPGSHRDTPAVTNSAVAKTPIWVIDGLAPANPALVEAAKDSLFEDESDAQIRKTFGAGGGLLLVVAESESPRAPIRDRTVNVAIDGIDEDRAAAVDELVSHSFAASRVTAAIIRMFLLEGKRAGWGSVVRSVEKINAESTANAKTILTGKASGLEATRPARVIADLTLGLGALSMLARKIGDDTTADRIGWSKYGLMTLAAEQVKQSMD
jgi:hypothetical protein